MFNLKHGLVENPIHRYAIGSRSEGLKYNSDGSLDLLIQNQVPLGRESNWLPGSRRTLSAHDAVIPS